MRNKKSDPKMGDMLNALNRVLKKYNGSILRGRSGYALYCQSAELNECGAYTISSVFIDDKCIGKDVVNTKGNKTHPKKIPFNPL